MTKIKAYFSKGELFLLIVSVTLILFSYLFFGGNGKLTLAASLIGAVSLILNAKGNPIGQLLMIVFSVLYGIISYSFAYYGEMITYLGMTAPMALFAFISWMRNPYNGNHSEVKINEISKKEYVFMAVLSAVVTFIFYFILEYFDTANIVPSTISVTTSFAAVYLTFRRSKFYAFAYAMNDIVLIILWSLASLDNSSYLSVVVCFGMFLVNDLYGFVSWHRTSLRQKKALAQ